MTMKNSKAKVKIGNQLTESFGINKGVKQGDGLSTTLFIRALHYAVNEVDQRGTIFTKSSQICAYADDIVIATRSEQRLMDVYTKLEEETNKMGLIVNQEKTKFMILQSNLDNSKCKGPLQNFELSKNLFLLYIVK